jgi:hypothetical protein
MNDKAAWHERGTRIRIRWDILMIGFFPSRINSINGWIMTDFALRLHMTAASAQFSTYLSMFAIETFGTCYVYLLDILMQCLGLWIIENSKSSSMIAKRTSHLWSSLFSDAYSAAPYRMQTDKIGIVLLNRLLFNQSFSEIFFQYPNDYFNYLLRQGKGEASCRKTQLKLNDFRSVRTSRFRERVLRIREIGSRAQRKIRGDIRFRSYQK